MRGKRSKWWPDHRADFDRTNPTNAPLIFGDASAGAGASRTRCTRPKRLPLPPCSVRPIGSGGAGINERPLRKYVVEHGDTCGSLRRLPRGHCGPPARRPAKRSRIGDIASTVPQLLDVEPGTGGNSGKSSLRCPGPSHQPRPRLPGLSVATKVDPRTETKRARSMCTHL
jgi:hypothetical protein